MAIIKVAVRCRPPAGADEKLEGAYKNLRCDHEDKVLIGDKCFTFDTVFNSSSSQQDVYDTSVLSLVLKFLSGSNAGIIAYGQTGSGKTYTMGTNKEQHTSDDSAGETVGIIPRTLQQIFSVVSTWNGQDSMQPVATVKVSFFEVYNEEVYDLLNVTRRQIVVREQSHEVKLSGLTEMEVSSYEEAMACLETGARIRTTGATAMNTHSSRSHAIFTVQLERHSSLKSTCVTSRLMMVDLAGSEVAKKTKTSGARFKEGVNINLGLFTLGNVINKLSCGKGCGHVPYRNSTLTRLLQSCLEGDSHSLFMSCISPMQGSILETTATLNYASRARAIEVRVNQTAHYTGTHTSQKKRAYTGGLTRMKSHFDANGRRIRKMPLLGNAYTPSAVTSDLAIAKEKVNAEDITNSNSLAGSLMAPISLRSLDESPGAEEVPQPVIEDSWMDLSAAETTISEYPMARSHRPAMIASNRHQSSTTAEVEFKIPKTPTRNNTIADVTLGPLYSPMARRICERIENSMSRLTNAMVNYHANPLNTPIRESIVDAVVRGISESRASFLQTPQDSSNVTLINRQRLSKDYSDSVTPRRRSVRLLSMLNKPHEKENGSATTISITSPLWLHSKSLSIGSSTHDSRMSSTKCLTIMSPNNCVNHKKKILHLLNRGSVRELQYLPLVGPKSALVLYNWRITNGPLSSIEEMRNITALPPRFCDRFKIANMCQGE